MNLFGPYALIQAFLPKLTRNPRVHRQPAVDSGARLATGDSGLLGVQGSRVLTFPIDARLAVRAGRPVHAVLTGPVDTDMSRDLDVPKAAPSSVARAIFDGVDNGDEEIFPDPLSATLAPGWRTGAVKALERDNAALVSAEPIS